MLHDNHSVLPGVGSPARVDHVAIQTAYGMLIGATTLLGKLGYLEVKNRRTCGDWGYARFLVKAGSIAIQLTDSLDDSVIPAGENHVAISVSNPRIVAEMLVEWCDWAGVKGAIAEEYGDKYFVTVTALLVQPLELVPHR